MIRTPFALSWSTVAALCGTVALALTLGTVPARAQMGGGIGAPSGPKQQAPKVRAPVLPGSKPAQNEVAPAPKNASDMSPNDALFDAINRGDIAAARDALNRGAQIDATNVLGMTPLALSVDLGRNNITFLLLSMRGDTGQEEGAPTLEADATPPPMPSRHVRVRRTPSPLSAPPASPAAAGGGVPVPSAGFLGFGR